MFDSIISGSQAVYPLLMPDIRNYKSVRNSVSGQIRIRSNPT